MRHDLAPFAAPVALFVALLCAGRAAHAQYSEVQPGARVRIHAPGIVAGRFVGTVLNRSGDTIRVGSPNTAPLDVPMARITSLEVSRGKSRASGAGRGALWGAGVGVAFGLAIVVADNGNTVYYEPNNGQVIALSLASGAFYGAIIGAIVGREQWDSYDLHTRTSLRVRPGQVAAGVTIGF